MRRVAEGIKNGIQLLRNFFGRVDHVGGGDDQVFRESAIPVHTHTLGGFAEVSAPGTAVAAMAANDMPLAGNDIADAAIFNTVAHFHDLAHVFVTRGGAQFYGLLRPFVPLPDMDVRSADGGLMDLDLHFPVSHGGNGNPLHGKPFFRLVLDQCPHGFLHTYVPSFQKSVRDLKTNRLHFVFLCSIVN